VTLSYAPAFLNSLPHHLKETAETGPGQRIELVIRHPFSLNKPTIDVYLAVIPPSVQRAGKQLCLPPYLIPWRPHGCPHNSGSPQAADTGFQALRHG